MARESEVEVGGGQKMSFLIGTRAVDGISGGSYGGIAHMPFSTRTDR